MAVDFLRSLPKQAGPVDVMIQERIAIALQSKNYVR